VVTGRSGGERLEELRARHPRFVYRSSAADRRGNDVRFSARFLLAPDIEFEPSVVIHDVPDGAASEVLNALAFHVGLAEIPSYWKAACPPEILVEAGPLTASQRGWWNELLANGMGEFVFVNDLDWDAVEPVRIDAHEDPSAAPLHPTGDGVMVPIGGGKDSAVTADLLRRHSKRLGAFVLNPTQAALDVARTARVDQIIVATRTIHPILLRLNDEGYLNGHTPFSAYLAFLASATAILFGFRSVVVSNERSSNEGNLTHRGRTVNHQWSKSWDFERAFREYSNQRLPGAVEYFSLLRPVWELQVARTFASLDRYHRAFRSCNRGMATNSWCGRCPKCLFVYTLLYRYLGQEQTATIFGAELFDREELVGIARDLLGEGEHKPLECVGTFDESRAAFRLCVERARIESGALPPLLAALDREVSLPDGTAARSFLDEWNDDHAVPAELEAAVRSEIGSRGGVALGTHPSA
jgi:UDP-N-acetyl-alpha-D-muramoyl-L-alanyl-L-glutamate epimerase